jgi:hypothetical protein
MASGAGALIVESRYLHELLSALLEEVAFDEKAE